jgi:hypothetical protein
MTRSGISKRLVVNCDEKPKAESQEPDKFQTMLADLVFYQI